MIKRQAKLLNKAEFFNLVHVPGYAGSEGTNKIELFNTVKCAVDDFSYQNKTADNANQLDTTLKITTYFFNCDLDMLVKINNKDTLYKITYIENVEMRNKKLIITLALYEGTIEND